MRLHWTEALFGKTLLVTDKESEYYGQKGRMVQGESDKPNHIYFESFDPIFCGFEYLAREQFTVIKLDRELKMIEREIEELYSKKEILETFKID